MNDLEQWRRCRDCKEIEVSNLGRVRKTICKTQVNVHVNGWGYVMAATYAKGYLKWYSVHRLVCIAFLNNPLQLKEVNHKNGIKTDNNLENLEWCTRRENIVHSINIGLRKSKKGMKYKTKDPKSKRQYPGQETYSTFNIEIGRNRTVKRNAKTAIEAARLFVNQHNKYLPNKIKVYEFEDDIVEFETASLK